MQRAIISLSLIFSIAGCASTSSPVESVDPPPAPIEITEIAAQVTKLYQEIDLAFDESFAAGIDFVIANNYPGAFDPVTLQECALVKQPFLGDNVTGGLPRVETLELVPNWIGEETNAADWLLGGQTLSAEVYRFDLEVDLEIITAEVVVADGQVFLLYGWCDAQSN